MSVLIFPFMHFSIEYPLEFYLSKTSVELPWWSSGKEFACQCRGRKFDLWLGKIPHAAGQLSPCSTTIGATCLEPMLCNKKATAMRHLCTRMKSNPCLLQLEKACELQWRHRAATQKKKKKNLYERGLEYCPPHLQIKIKFGFTHPGYDGSSFLVRR